MEDIVLILFTRRVDDSAVGHTEDIKLILQANTAVKFLKERKNFK